MLFYVKFAKPKHATIKKQWQYDPCDFQELNTH